MADHEMVKHREIGKFHENNRFLCYFGMITHHGLIFQWQIKGEFY